MLEKSPSVLWKSLVVCLTSLFKRYTKKHPGIGEITIIAFDCFSCLTQSLVVLRNDVKQQRNPQIHNQKTHPGHQNLLLHTMFWKFWKPSLCVAISAFSFNLSAFFIIVSRSANSKHPGYSQCWWLETIWYLYLVRLNSNTYQDWFLTPICMRLISTCYKSFDLEILRGIQA